MTQLPPGQDFEELTLSELIGQLVRAPRETLKLLALVIAPLETHTPRKLPIMQPTTDAAPADKHPAPASQSTDRAWANVDMTAAARLVWYGLAVLIAWWGNWLYVHNADVNTANLPFVDVITGIPFLLAALVITIGGALISDRKLRDLFRQSTPADNNDTDVSPTPEEALITHTDETEIADDVWGSPRRTMLLVGAIVMAIGAFLFNAGNQFTLIGVIAWVGCVLLSIAAFAPPLNFAQLKTTFSAIKTFPQREKGTFIALGVILLLAAFIRFEHLDVMLPEMTSDHVEKLLDAQRIADGNHSVFMEGNGGREIMQFYLLAWLGQLPGLKIDFTLLKVLAAIEGLLTIPVFWALGRELIGDRNRRFGNFVGVAFALVAAIAYWHIQVSRIALRIILTPLFVSLILIYLIRAMRHNRRADFIKAGLLLGIGLYTYQAMRMVPVLVVIGVMLAVLFNRPYSWKKLRRYAFNFVALVWVAFMVFMPLFRYSVEYPASFWSRTSGRLFGEDVIEVTSSTGEVTWVAATLGDRIAALNENLPILADNLFNALMMFNYRGDIIFLHNAPQYPHLDPLLGALLIVGLGAWIVWIARHRQASDVLVLLGIVVLLLPSALAIALPNENPSTTRASGAMPLVLFLVAFGVATIGWQIAHLAARPMVPFQSIRWLTVRGAAAVLVVMVYGYTSWVIFAPYREVYVQSWHSISEAGRVMRGFADSGGAMGNAFVLSYKYWWDYRAIAIEAGLTPGIWNNGDINVSTLPDRMAEAVRAEQPQYALNPDKDLLIFYHRDDFASELLLQQWFPRGYSTYYPVTLAGIPPRPDRRLSDKDFKTYRVPAMGYGAFAQFLESYATQSP